MIYVGVDIGSTASKVVTRGDKELHFVLPTGWSSKDTAEEIKQRLLENGVDVDSPSCYVVATGYGRVSVEYADEVVTEISCHGRGGKELFGGDCTIVDVGGQDTKVIMIQNGLVVDFLMNDKCSAGTGKFLEIMANRLGVNLNELFELAKAGSVISISSLCTVFAESEVISYIGQGIPREDIAAGVVDSVATKVAQLCNKRGVSHDVVLTGGLSFSEYFSSVLGEKLGVTITPREFGRYAGAYGAALIASSNSNPA